MPFICCLSMSVMASPMCIVALDAAVGFVFDPRGKKRGFHVVAEQHSTAFYGGFLAFPANLLDFGFVGFYEGFFFPVCINPVCLVGYSTRVPCWVPEMLTLAYISVHFLFAPYALKSLVFHRFSMKKGLPDFSENPQGGVRGIRTLEPLKTTNTLAGCPYRPLRHDSTVLPFSRRNSM